MAADDIFAGSGQCLSGPHGTPLPADIGDMSGLDTAMLDLGTVSEDGLEHAFSVDKTVIKDWNGRPVRIIGTSSEISFKLTFLETNAEVLAHYYGATVESTTTGSKITLDQPADVNFAMVIPVEDPSTGKLRVYVLPRVQVMDRESQTVKPDESGFGLTYHAIYDETVGSCGYILFDQDMSTP